MEGHGTTWHATLLSGSGDPSRGGGSVAASMKAPELEGGGGETHPIHITLEVFCARERGREEALNSRRLSPLPPAYG